MKLFEPFSLGTNLCLGYTLEEALELVQQSGFEYAELSSIVNMCEHIDPKQINDDYIAWVKELLAKMNIKCHAVSGHVDLTIEEQLQDFLKKIEFAGKIGAKIINTNSGPLERIEIFHKNMPKIIGYAERYNVIIGLESHGDIIGTAKDSMHIFKRYNHPLVRFNYDTGNTLFYCNGNIHVEEDIKYGLEYMEHLHLKDIHIEGNQVEYRPIGGGDIDFVKLFEVLKDYGKTIPCGLEIPTHVKGVLGAIKPADVPMPREAILADVKQSVDFVNTLL